MNRLALASLSLLALLPLAAQQAPQQAGQPKPATVTPPPAGFAQSIVLWPGGAPGAKGTAEGDVPKLFTYPTTGAGPHAAVIVMPGGGYTHLVMEQEGAYEARWLAAHGVAAFVLEYRLAPMYLYPAQSQDASRAVRYARAHAAELGVDPAKLGVWGFSAGGSLAGYLATIHSPGNPAAADPIDRVSDRPDFEIVSYGRLDMSVPLANGTLPKESILGPQPTQAATDAIDPVKHASADTSPSFIYSTTGDMTVDSRNAADFYVALKRLGVPAELHIFELGQHGTHMGEDARPAQHELTVFPTLLGNWMQLHGWMPAAPQ
ncbi:MAG: alpha/beta hydrolase [Acidobacteriaceae bacterium]|jgi:acetyl esterase/lipase